MGSQQNSFDLLKHVDADYLALCEGDDYWTDENKLQLQVDLLENNKQLNGCFHKTEIIKEKNVTSWNSDKYFPKDENGRQFWPTNLQKRMVKMADVLPGIIATSSIVYRYDKNFKYPEWFKTCIAGDRPMHCFMIKDGSFQYIDKVMSVYRISKKGVWFNKNDENNLVEETENWVKMLNNLDDFFHKKFACIDFYRNETIKKAIYDSYEKQNTENLSKLMHIFKKIFFENVKYVGNQYNIKHIDCDFSKVYYYEFLGIPIWKIKENHYKRKYYLFGFIQVMVIKSTGSFL